MKQIDPFFLLDELICRKMFQNKIVSLEMNLELYI